MQAVSSACAVLALREASRLLAYYGPTVALAAITSSAASVPAIEYACSRSLHALRRAIAIANSAQREQLGETGVQSTLASLATRPPRLALQRSAKSTPRIAPVWLAVQQVLAAACAAAATERCCVLLLACVEAFEEAFTAVARADFAVRQISSESLETTDTAKGAAAVRFALLPLRQHHPTKQTTLTTAWSTCRYCSL